MRRWGSAGLGQRSCSFIARAKEHGVQTLLGSLSHQGGFDASVGQMRVTRMDEQCNEAEAEITVTEDLTNAYGTLHGGAICTIVDVMGTLALLTRDASRGGVSVDISTQFFRPIQKETVVHLKASVTKYGKNLGFTQVDLTSAQGQLLARGTHCKAFPQTK